MSLIYQWGIHGHDYVLRQLEEDLQGNKISHAYLLSGPREVGKFTAAKTLAHILQCPDGYCHSCAVCREIERGYHSDTFELSDNQESIKIDQIRAFVEKLNMTRQSPYKILLMQNIERMTPDSANALLKTLEDPPENVVFLLTTSNIKAVLATIISRVRLVKFRRLSDDDIAAVIRDSYPEVSDAALETICSFSLGRPGKALAFMRDAPLYESYRKLFDDIELFLAHPDRASQFSYIGDLTALAKERKDPTLIQDFLEVFLVVLRKQLLMKAREGRGILPEEKLLNVIEKVQEARELMKRNVNTRLLLENMMLSL